MSKSNFTKSLMLHIRYPWTAACILVLWIGSAIMGAIMHLEINELMILLGANCLTTILVAMIGFKR